MNGKNDSKILIIVCSILFIILTIIGFNLARNKPLWNDEVFSQVASVHNVSYWGILSGASKGEGNICPLFYLIQKVLTDVTPYKTPSQWIDGNWLYLDLPSLMFLRAQAVVFMALTIVVLFYYFSRYHSILTGIYAVMVSLSSHMLWLYWAEARHYALWFFLTVVQSLLFLSILKQKKPDKRLYSWLIAVHVLLSFTVILSMGQIVIISFLVWLLKDKNYKQQLWLMVVPAVICFFYYFQTEATRYWVDGNYLSFILPCIPEDRLILIGVYAVLLAVISFQKKDGWAALYKKNLAAEGQGYLYHTFLMLLASAVLMFLFKIRTHGHEGNPISTRYFIYLTPLSIVATVLFSDHLVRMFHGKKWTQINLIIILFGLVVFSYLRNTMWVVGLY